MSEYILNKNTFPTYKILLRNVFNPTLDINNLKYIHVYDFNKNFMLNDFVSFPLCPFHYKVKFTQMP